MPDQEYYLQLKYKVDTIMPDQGVLFLQLKYKVLDGVLGSVLIAFFYVNMYYFNCQVKYKVASQRCMLVEF